MSFQPTRREAIVFGCALAAGCLTLSNINGPEIRHRNELNWNSLQLDSHLNTIKSVLYKYASPSELISNEDKDTIRENLDFSLRLLPKINRNIQEVLGSMHSPKDTLYRDCVANAEAYTHGSPPSFDMTNQDLKLADLEPLTTFLKSDSFPLGAYGVLAEDDSDNECLLKIQKLNDTLKVGYRALVNNYFYKETNLDFSAKSY